METTTFASSSHPLAEPIKFPQNLLMKRNTEYWVQHSCSHFLDLFAPSSTPPTFQIPSKYLELQDPHTISGPKSSPNLLQQAQRFKAFSDQTCIASNIVYAAWRLSRML